LTVLRAGLQGRRSRFRQAGLAAVAGGTGAGLAAGAAEGGAPSAGEPPASSSAPAPSGGPSYAGSPSASTGPSATAGSSAPPKGIVVAAADVPEGGGVVVQEKYVVTQPAAGEYKAFSAICTHQGCPVDKVENNAIVCPCHGSQFAIDSGDPVAGPAREALPSVELARSGDDLVLPE